MKVPNEMTDDLLIDSFKTMNQLKSNDSYRSKLLDQHQQVNQKLTHFYDKALKNTENEITPFNKASLFNDMKNWISKYESNKEKKEQLKSQIELLSNELKQLKEQLEENEKLLIHYLLISMFQVKKHIINLTSNINCITNNLQDLMI